MELDLRFKQYAIDLNEIAEKDVHEKTTEIKPYQELVDYFEANKSNFCHQDFIKNIITPQGNTQLTLSDGTKVLVGNSVDVINVAIQFPNNTKFMGMWTKLTDSKDFIKKSQELANS